MIRLWQFAKAFGLYEDSNGQNDAIQKEAEVLYLAGEHLLDAKKTLDEILDTHTQKPCSQSGAHLRGLGGLSRQPS